MHNTIAIDVMMGSTPKLKLPGRLFLDRIAVRNTNTEEIAVPMMPKSTNTNFHVLGRCKDIVITPTNAAIIARTATTARIATTTWSMFTTKGPEYVLRVLLSSTG